MTSWAFRMVALGLFVGASGAGAQDLLRTRPVGDVPATAMERAALDRDVQLIIEWQRGAWDTYARNRFERDAGLPEDLRNPHESWEYTPVELPAIGSHVLKVVKTKNGQPSAPQFWSFTPIYEKRLVQMRIFTPQPRSRSPGAALTDAEIAKLELADYRSLPPECGTHWIRQGDHFEVEILGKCGFPPGAAKPTAYHGSRSSLSPKVNNVYTWDLDLKGRMIEGNPAGIARQFLKARPFRCMATSLQPDGSRGDAIPAIRLHDQGGQAHVGTRAEQVLLWTEVPEIAGRVDTLRLEILRAPDGPVMASASTAAGATQIGVSYPAEGNARIDLQCQAGASAGPVR